MADASLNVTSLFGDSEHQVAGDHLQEGTVFAAFGSSDIDLRRASTAPDGANLKIIVGFGSVRLTVPDHWAVSVETKALFAEVASKRAAPDSPKGRLTLTGWCLFGNVDVRS